jgi:hypothetical protein
MNDLPDYVSLDARDNAWVLVTATLTTRLYGGFWKAAESLGWYRAYR